MKRSLKKALLIAFIPILLCVFFVPAYAALDPGTAPGGLSNTELMPMISKISSTILALVGIIAVLFLIIGGFQFITASGNPDQTGRAKSMILYAIIGLIIAILSWAVVQFIITRLT